MPEIKMDYAMMEDMKQAFQKGAEDLDDTRHEMSKIAGMLDEGALVGDCGNAFVDAIQGVLTTKITELINKFEEIQRDLQHAVNAMKEQDSETTGEMGL